MSEPSKNLLTDYDDAPAFADDAETLAEANNTGGFDGDKIRIREVENKRIIFVDFRTFPSKYQHGNTCVEIQIVINGQKRVLFTGSKRIARTLELFKDKLPRAGKLINEGRSWKIT